MIMGWNRQIIERLETVKKKKKIDPKYPRNISIIGPTTNAFKTKQSYM